MKHADLDWGPDYPRWKRTLVGDSDRWYGDIEHRWYTVLDDHAWRVEVWMGSASASWYVRLTLVADRHGELRETVMTWDSDSAGIPEAKGYWHAMRVAGRIRRELATYDAMVRL